MHEPLFLHGVKPIFNEEQFSFYTVEITHWKIKTLIYYEYDKIVIFETQFRICVYQVVFVFAHLLHMAAQYI